MFGWIYLGTNLHCIRRRIQPIGGFMEEVEIQLVENFVVELVHKIRAKGELVSGLP